MLFTRRVFIGHISAGAASLRSLLAGGDSPASRAEIGQSAAPITPAILPAPAAFPAAIPGHWGSYGRLACRSTTDSVILQDGFAIDSESRQDTVFRFSARAPVGSGPVQIWAGVRCRDRDSRYVFALRGGDNNDVYLARYAPDGAASFLGVAPLDFRPEPGTWYRLRLVARGNRFHLYVNDEATPRIDVVDAGASWTSGGISLGGGWLPVEYREIEARPLTEEESRTFDGLGAPPLHQEPPIMASEAVRVNRRAAYSPMRVSEIAPMRTEISMDGDWLFLPDQELGSGDASSRPIPSAPDFDDTKWHVMDVPNFWTPTLTWLHGETGFPQLPGVASTKGICDKVYLAEMSRLESYTFSWRDTRSAWYRHYVDLPAGDSGLKGKRFCLRFDAIAKVSEIWVNGIRVGAHVGMFGEVDCDATAAIRPGRNSIAVHAVGQSARNRASQQVVGVAVTVEVTAEMLNTLPHGMYPGNAGGIWQPVTLVITDDTCIDTVYIQPHLDGLDCELTLHLPETTRPSKFSASYVIRAKTDGSVLYEQPAAALEPAAGSISVAGGGSGALFRFSTPKLAPQHWSPQAPNLYELEITLFADDRACDKRTETFGFRTFAVENGRLALNGRPFWMRGANHFPNALRPNDRKLARKFMQLAREGNVVATRSHTAPFTKAWLDAADETGIGVSLEGTWPWLMLRGNPPADDLLKAWHDEFAGMIRTHRNHPCILLWTVNNEMKFPASDRSRPDVLKRKWTILSSMVKAIRSGDPTRPVVCDSSYDRNEVASEYRDLIQPSGFDDGDIDDVHRYYGWYDESFFHLLPRAAPQGSFGARQHWAGRPMISQEMSTGYPRNDDGHPTRFYLFKHYTPQTFVGDEAYENRDPAIFLSRQAFLTKELAETFRRSYRDTCSGILHFAYASWFKDAWNADKVQPFETYHALKKALQPILVSAELTGRHRYAGSRWPLRLCVANDSDSGAPLPACRITWEVRATADAQVLASGNVAVSPVPYYANAWVETTLILPKSLPTPRLNALLSLRLEHDGTTLSENDYDLVLATEQWAAIGTDTRMRPVALFDPAGQASPAIRKLAGAKLASLGELRPGQLLVIAGAEEALSPNESARRFLDAYESADRVRRFVEAGGRALLLNAKTALPRLLPAQILSYRACDGEIVSMHVPESPVFDGIAPLDLAWFTRPGDDLPRACTGAYRIVPGAASVAALAEVIDRHGYLQKPNDLIPISGSPLVELRFGQGILIASEMHLDAAADDPIAGRLIANLIRRLRSANA